MTPRDDVRRLETEFAEAMQRMYVVGNGLARLRTELDATDTAVRAAARPMPAPAAPAPTFPAPSGPPVRPDAPTASAPPSAWGPPTGGVGTQGEPTPPPPSPATAGASRKPWYRRDGAVTRVLAVSGAVVTLAGVAMLLVLAVRHGWFGPAARVAAGAALAAALGVLGARGGARDRAADGVVGSAPVALVATGAAAAYLDVVAVTVLYGWVPPVLGLLLCVLVGGVGLRLARSWSSPLLAVLVVAGTGLFAPVVAGRPGWLLSAVLAVLAAAGWWAGLRAPSPVLTVARTVPVVLSLLVGAQLVTSAAGLAPLLLVAVLTTAGTVGAAVAGVRRSPEDVTSSVAAGLAVTALVAVAAVQPRGIDTLAQATTAGVLLLAASTLARPPVGPLPAHLVAVLATGGALSAVVAVVDGAPASLVGTGLLLLALGHAAVAGTTRSRISLALAGGLGPVALLPWLQHPLAMMGPSAAARHDLVVAFVDSTLVAALVAVLAWATTQVRGVPSPVRTLARTGGLGVGLVALLTAVVGVGTMAGSALGAPEVGFTAGHALATVCWMVAAAALLLHSLDRRPDADLWLRLGLAVAALAVAKLFLFDLAALSGLVRSLAFTGTGLLLLATGSRYARAWERVRTQP